MATRFRRPTTTAVLLIIGDSILIRLFTPLDNADAVQEIAPTALRIEIVEHALLSLVQLDTLTRQIFAVQKLTSELVSKSARGPAR